jgi:hypothetical protein
MIARVWRGIVHSDKLEEYVDVVEETGMEEYRRTPGNLGAQILTISWWPDEDHIRGFAGEDIELAKYYPSDDPYLIERDDNVVHYTDESD